ncbi:hypothetical protein BDZ94DRAFT_1156637 [Collybia nuda]|uniref:MYND-type domain-containing protein n=1 Tax=Collybia nuda TaxID=64659 RepID=A0A9P5YEJ5_9AGAR|nr:hypothetical protein BDZ94DRAFT_1156637 [Collybia nuda]
MGLTCYYCNKTFPSAQMKRCSRCLLVTYCSKECQTHSWKISHKQNYKIHPSIVSTTDPDKPVSKAERPKKFTDEWIELEIDRALSRWMQIWCACFQAWAKICLDLANHPPERVVTHCMQLVVEPRHFGDDPAKQYNVLEASVVPIAEVLEDHPTLEISIDPSDFTRLRLVVILVDSEGEERRLRLLQWNERNIGEWRKMGKEASARLAGDSPESQWAQTLMHAVDSMNPKDVERMLGRP